MTRRSPRSVHGSSPRSVLSLVWPPPPATDTFTFVENADSTKRARVTLPSGSLRLRADEVESGQFGEEAKRMLAALSKMCVATLASAIPIRPDFLGEWEEEPNLQCSSLGKEESKETKKDALFAKKEKEDWNEGEGEGKKMFLDRAFPQRCGQMS